MFKIILMLFMIASCQEVKETVRVIPGPLVVFNYSLELDPSTPDLTIINEESFVDYSFVYILENKSTREEGGVISDIAINKPIINPIQNSSGVDLISTQINTPQGLMDNCEVLSLIDANAKCAIKVYTNFTNPLNEDMVIYDQISTVKITSTIYPINKNINIILKKKAMNSSKNILALMKTKGVDEDELDSFGYPRGSFLMSIKQNREKHAPCLLDENLNPSFEGIDKKEFKRIGNKTFFIARGCSENAGMRELESYSVWVFNDGAVPNLERVSHDVGNNSFNNQPSNLTVMGPLLFYIAPTSFYSSHVDNTNTSKEALFLYDTTLPLGLNNPREIDTGYIRLDSAHGIEMQEKTSNATNLAVHNQKLYFYGKSFKSDGTNLSVKSGILEYDPFVAEDETNPKEIYVVDELVLDAKASKNSGMIVTDYIIATSFETMELGLNIGKELVIVDKNTGNLISQFDLCIGTCSSNIRNLVELYSGDIALSITDDQNNNRVALINSEFNSTTLKYEYGSVTVFTEDVLSDVKLVKRGNDVFYKAMISAQDSTVMKLKNKVVSPLISSGGLSS